MNILNSIPSERLSRERENELARAIHKSGGSDQDSINELVLHAMKEAFLYSKKCCRSQVDDGALFSLCYKTLERNAKRFSPGKARFFAFTKVAIRGAIKRYWSDLDTVKNSSLHEDESIVPKSRVLHPLEDHDYVLGYDNEDNEPAVDPEFDTIHMRERLALIKPIVQSKLTAQEQMILDLVYNSGFNFREIGTLLSMSRSVAQLNHSRALKKIRCELLRRKRLLA